MLFLILHVSFYSCYCCLLFHLLFFFFRFFFYILILFYFFFFFFFQAEDGIRDRTVTGVQTCALPIYTVPQLVASSGARIFVGVASWTDPSMTAPGVFYPEGVTKPEARLRFYARSEERRVGKECRSRWSGEQ